MIEQVRFKETSKNANGVIIDSRTIFGFGSHPLAQPNDYPAGGQGQEAVATATGQRFRIIMDELLVGNNLEQIACRAPIDDDAFDSVPLGTTPDDIAKCAAPSDVLKGSCPATMEHSVCICKIDGGCGTVVKGEPVGVLDVNQDGAADDTRFMAGSVGVRCGTIDVPVDLDGSYWNPSGDQNKPAMGGFDVLGPAIVLATAALPTSLECNLTFNENVVDKQSIKVCAPPNGDVTAGCDAGDLSAFKFKVTPLRVVLQSQGMGAPVANPIFLAVSAPMDVNTLGAVSITQNGTPVAGAVIESSGASNQTIKITGTFAPNTTYDINVTNALTDAYGQALPMAYATTVTTGS